MSTLSINPTKLKTKLKINGYKKVLTFNHLANCLDQVMVTKDKVKITIKIYEDDNNRIIYYTISDMLYFLGYTDNWDLIQNILTVWDDNSGLTYGEIWELIRGKPM